MLSNSRQSLVKGERLVRHDMTAVLNYMNDCRVCMVTSADRDGRALHLERIAAVLLARLDLALRQLARMDRIAPGVFRACQIVRHGLDFEDVQAAEFRDLFEAEAGVVDQPGGGRMGHEGLGLVGHFRRLV